MNTAFSQAQVDKILAAFRLPFNTPLSVLAVELFNSESLVIGEQGFNAEALQLDEGSLSTSAGAAVFAAFPSR